MTCILHRRTWKTLHVFLAFAPVHPLLAFWLPRRGGPVGSHRRRVGGGRSKGSGYFFLRILLFGFTVGWLPPSTKDHSFPPGASPSLSAPLPPSSFSSSLLIYIITHSLPLTFKPGSGNSFSCWSLGTAHCSLWLSYTLPALCKLFRQIGVCHWHPARLGVLAWSSTRRPCLHSECKIRESQSWGRGCEKERTDTRESQEVKINNV